MIIHWGGLSTKCGDPTILPALPPPGLVSAWGSPSDAAAWIRDAHNIDKRMRVSRSPASRDYKMSGFGAFRPHKIQCGLKRVPRRFRKDFGPQFIKTANLEFWAAENWLGRLETQFPNFDVVQISASMVWIYPGKDRHECEFSSVTTVRNVNARLFQRFAQRKCMTTPRSCSMSVFLSPCCAKIWHKARSSVMNCSVSIAKPMGGTCTAPSTPSLRPSRLLLNPRLGNRADDVFAASSSQSMDTHIEAGILCDFHRVLEGHKRMSWNSIHCAELNICLFGHFHQILQSSEQITNTLNLCYAATEHLTLVVEVLDGDVGFLTAKVRRDFLLCDRNARRWVTISHRGVILQLMPLPLERRNSWRIAVLRACLPLATFTRSSKLVGSWFHKDLGPQIFRLCKILVLEEDIPICGSHLIQRERGEERERERERLAPLQDWSHFMNSILTRGAEYWSQSKMPACFQTPGLKSVQNLLLAGRSLQNASNLWKILCRNSFHRHHLVQHLTPYNWVSQTQLVSFIFPIQIGNLFRLCFTNQQSCVAGQCFRKM